MHWRIIGFFIHEFVYKLYILLHFMPSVHNQLMVLFNYKPSCLLLKVVHFDTKEIVWVRQIWQNIHCFPVRMSKIGLTMLSLLTYVTNMYFYAFWDLTFPHAIKKVLFTVLGRKTWSTGWSCKWTIMLNHYLEKGKGFRQHFQSFCWG